MSQKVVIVDQSEKRSATGSEWDNPAYAQKRAELSRQINSQVYREKQTFERFEKTPAEKALLAELKFVHHESVKQAGYSPSKRINVSDPQIARIGC